MDETIWKFYNSNQETLDAMIDACELANKTIDLEQFIFVPDNFGNKLIDICEKKSRQGVKIRFLWDSAGSFSFFGNEMINKLKERGIELVFFKTLLPNFLDVPNYKSWYLRNHRRTLVIDGEIAFTGSICIWERTKDWKDANVMVKGPVVKDMQRAFERMWDRSQKKKLPKIFKDTYSDHEFRYISNNPFPRNKRLYYQTVEAIRNSKKYVYITTPYFVPTHRISRVLRLAAHRGVDVRIIIPERSDHSLVDIAARTYFHSLLKSGIRIFIYRNRMLHSKTISIDDDWSSIGTLNIDHVSLLYNFEANLVSINHRFTSEIKSQFLIDIANSSEVSFKEWKERYWAQKLSEFFIKLIRTFF